MKLLNSMIAPAFSLGGDRMKPLFGLAALVVGMLFPANARAEIILIVDLTVEDTITVLATDGNASATITGDDFTGVYLENFFSGPAEGYTYVEGSGDFSTPSSIELGDGPGIYREDNDTGLNVFYWTDDDDASFTSGSRAFVGSVTWALESQDYAQLVAANLNGDIYFPADNAEERDSATLIGQYQVIVPEPTSLALLGLGGVALLYRRRQPRHGARPLFIPRKNSPQER